MVSWKRTVALFAFFAGAVACGSSDPSDGGSPQGDGGAGGSAESGGTTSGGGSLGGASSSGGETAAAGGELAGGGTGGVPAIPCAALSPEGCLRGLYLSLDTDHVGQITFADEDLIYAHVLGDEAKEQHLLDFIGAQGITSLSLYNLNVILADEGKSSQLADFMGRARAAGVSRIEAIGAEYTFAWDDIFEFHQNLVPFDGFLTEIEFWQEDATFEEFIDTLNYVRSLSFRPTLSGEAPTLSAYVGWPDAAEVEAMAPLLDRVLVHLYVDTAPQAYSYGSERFALFAAANEKLGTTVEVLPIFSSEDAKYAAGSEFFMGEWLGENGLAAAETQFLEDFAAADWGPELTLLGHQYYSYFFLDKYLP